MNIDAAHAARMLMGDSLGFHIIFVLFGLTFPLIVCWFEWLGIRRNDPKLIALAKFWSKIMAVLVITGVISGTVIALQMSLVWPGILKFGGEVIGLPFLFETYAFLIEATFLSLYMATWNNKRVSKRVHLFFGVLMWLGATVSAYAITSVNSWMNLPSGFTYVNGKISNVSVFKAMFSETSIIEFVHSMPGYYLAAALSVAGLYAFKILRTKQKYRELSKHRMDWYVIRTLVLFSACMFVLSGITADITGKYLAKKEAVKLAALELNYETRSNAPLLIGGVAGENNTIKGPHFEIPGALSLLAGNTTDTKVTGLSEFKKEDQPPLYVHTFFDIKMTLITALFAVYLAYFAINKWRRRWLSSTPSLIVLSILGLMSICIVELGWMMTEIGRQPWAVRGYVTVAEALTKTHQVSSFGFIFPLAYLLLFGVTIAAIWRIVQSETSTAKGEK
jgi:cytochrome bd ubiquinol oxidase subunit I